MAATETDKYGDGNFDSFYDWAKNRSDLIAADNQSAQNMGDPGNMDSAQGFPLGPGMDPNAPAYNGPVYSSPVPYSLGAPIYGSTADLFFGNGFLNPYGPFGMGPYPYAVWLVVPRYRRVHSSWPDRPTSSRWVPNRMAIPPVHAGIPRYVPYRSTYTSGVVVRRYVPATPAPSRPVSVMPHVSARPMMAHPIGHR